MRDKGQTLRIGKSLSDLKNILDQNNGKLYTEILQKDISKLKDIETETTERKPERERNKNGKSYVDRGAAPGTHPNQNETGILKRGNDG